MVLVKIALAVAALLVGVAELLASTAETLPPANVPAACVQVPAVGAGQLQAGYCP